MMEQVRRFHVEVTGTPMPDSPRMLTGERLEFGLRHLREEINELEQATTIEEQADALIDEIYVAMGRLLEMGLPPGPLFDEVHRANMQRRSGKNARRGNAPFDAVKPDGWTGPQLQLYCTVTKAEMDWLLDQREIAANYDPSDFEKDGVTPIIMGTRHAAGVRPRPKVLVLGYGRHGKDTVASMLAERFGLSFTSSSRFCAEHVVLPFMNANGWHYASADECFHDRHRGDHRKVWYNAITRFNCPDASSLGQAIFSRYDVYAGLRSSREFHAVKAAGLYDLCVWVDASGRGLPPEDRSSCTVEPWMADHVIDNSGDFDELRLNVDRLMEAKFGLEPRGLLS